MWQEGILEVNVWKLAGSEDALRLLAAALLCSGNALDGGGHIVLQKSRSHLTILGPRRVTWNKFQTKDLRILADSVQNEVSMATSLPELYVPRELAD
jgi:hypothetical protein